jgi:hypothetical protein
MAFSGTIFQSRFFNYAFTGELVCLLKFAGWQDANMVNIAKVFQKQPKIRLLIS